MPYYPEDAVTTLITKVSFITEIQGNTMQKIISISAALSVILLSNPALAKISKSESYNQVADQMCSSFYVGADLAKSNLKFKNGYGANIFAKNPTEGSLFLGTKFTEHFGVEAGYTEQFKKKRTATIGAGDNLPGQPQQTAGQFLITTSDIKGHHPYIGISINQTFTNNDAYSVAALIGVSISKIIAEFKVTTSDFGALTPAEVINNTSSFSKTKAVPMIKLSAARSFNKSVSAHIFGVWKNLSKIKMQAKQFQTVNIRLKDGYSLGLGLTFSPF